MLTHTPPATELPHYGSLRQLLLVPAHYQPTLLAALAAAGSDAATIAATWQSALDAVSALRIPGLTGTYTTEAVTEPGYAGAVPRIIGLLHTVKATEPLHPANLRLASTLMQRGPYVCWLATARLLLAADAPCTIQASFTVGADRQTPLLLRYHIQWRSRSLPAAYTLPELFFTLPQ